MTTILPQIESILLSEFIIDTSLSGRTEKEIEDNAKALAPVLTSSGGWDSSYPGTYFERDGAKHLLTGFTRTAAAKSAGITSGFFVRTDDDYQANKVACITSNCGKPISMQEQGRIYEDMLAWLDENDCPWSTDRIAKHVGYSRQHVENCLGIFHETPEIAELLAAGLISAHAVTKARQQVKDDAKRLKYLKTAIEEAAGAKATEKHLDAVKSRFVKVKAVPETNPTSAPEPEPTRTEPERESNSGGSSEPQPLDFGQPEPAPTPAPQSSANRKAIRVQYRTTIEEWSNANGIECNDGQIADLLDRLMDLGVPF